MKKTQKNSHGREGVCIMWYRFMLIYINFNFDFLGLDNVYF
jgi:hypothetical protein